MIPALSEPPGLSELAPLGVLLAATTALGVYALTLTILWWPRARRHATGAIVWLVALWAWCAAIALAYRGAPAVMSILQPASMAAAAVLAALVWPVGRVMMADPAARAPRPPAVAAGSLGVAVAAGLLTVALLAPAEVSVPKQFEEIGRAMMESRVGVLLLVTCAAVSEELVYRLGFFTFLAHAFRRVDRRGLIAMAVSSMLWALPHAGMLSPAWIKYAQIFGFGILQCVLLRWSRTIAAPILAHALFNVGVVAVSWIWPEWTG